MESLILNVVINEEDQLVDFSLSNNKFVALKKTDGEVKDFIDNPFVKGTFKRWFSLDTNEVPCSVSYYHRHDVESFRRAINHLNENGVTPFRCLVLGTVDDYYIYPIEDLGDSRRKLINTKPKNYKE